MALMSIEEAKSRLQEYNILLKYMDFLQSNGLTDCGKGQIIGQTSFLQEYIKGERKEEATHKNTEERYKNIDLLDHVRQGDYEKRLTIETKNSIDTRVKKIDGIIQESSTGSNVFKSGILKQVGNLIDRAKDKTMIQQRKDPEFGTEPDERHIDNKIKTSQLSSQSITNARISTTKDKKQIQGESEIEGQQEDESLFDKIKKSTDVDNWQWQ
jgi:hypothetical protein